MLTDSLDVSESLSAASSLLMEEESQTQTAVPRIAAAAGAL